MIKSVTLTLVLLLALSACTIARPEPTPGGPDDPVSSADLPSATLAWQGSDLGGESIGVSNPARYLITFNPDGSLTLQADCNGASGTYRTDGSGGIEIEVGAITRMGCPPDTQDQEFLRQLGAATRYRVEGETLLLELADGGGTMTLAPLAASGGDPLPTGATLAWQGSDLGGESIGVSDPARYLITFNPDGSVSIQADCNMVGGSYTSDEGGALDIALGPSTLVGCPEDTQDTEFLQQLDGVDRYRVEGETLLLELADGGGTMFFAGLMPEGDASLTGTNWNITAYAVPGSETIASVPVDAPASLLFNDDGTISGSTGCNSFGGSYTLDGETLTLSIGPMTEMACEEPRMTQERQIVAALGAVNAVSIEGQRMALHQGETLIIQAEAARP